MERSSRRVERDALDPVTTDELETRHGREVPPRPIESPGDGTAPPVEEPPEKGHRKRSFWRELPVLVVLAFAIALLIKTFALQAFYIPSASMVPTLDVGDRVLVEKVSYRFGGPTRGDVVVFERDLLAVVEPVEGEDERSIGERISESFRELLGFPTGGAQDFIKRVMAVEGDTIEGREGRVFVNGDVVEEPYLPPNTETSTFGPVTVGRGEVFVMGDNRGNSDDSRNFGPVPVDTIVGHAFVLIWPAGDVGTL